MRLDTYTMFCTNAAVMVPETFHSSNEDHWRAVFSPLGTAPGFTWRMECWFLKGICLHYGKWVILLIQSVCRIYPSCLYDLQGVSDHIVRQISHSFSLTLKKRIVHYLLLGHLHFTLINHLKTVHFISLIKFIS